MEGGIILWVPSPGLSQGCLGVGILHLWVVNLPRVHIPHPLCPLETLVILCGEERGLLYQTANPRESSSVKALRM